MSHRAGERLTTMFISMMERMATLEHRQTQQAPLLLNLQPSNLLLEFDSPTEVRPTTISNSQHIVNGQTCLVVEPQTEGEHPRNQTIQTMAENVRVESSASGSTTA
ncbi:hypothetical protein M5689_018385 [Euphorbia peplus]|nr:hypothetical protein M5689_018385 [Euphorbia peplus]